MRVPLLSGRCCASWFLTLRPRGLRNGCGNRPGGRRGVPVRPCGGAPAGCPGVGPRRLQLQSAPDDSRTAETWLADRLRPDALHVRPAGVGTALRPAQRGPAGAHRRADLPRDHPGDGLPSQRRLARADRDRGHRGGSGRLLRRRVARSPARGSPPAGRGWRFRWRARRAYWRSSRRAGPVPAGGGLLRSAPPQPSCSRATPP